VKLVFKEILLGTGSVIVDVKVPLLAAVPKDRMLHSVKCRKVGCGQQARGRPYAETTKSRWHVLGFEV
jgi:hypothetical protein